MAINSKNKVPEFSIEQEQNEFAASTEREKIKGSKNLNVPPLRFPEFTDEWTDTTIGSIATVVGGGTPDTTQKDNWDGNILWYTPSEIGKEKYLSDSERRITNIGLKSSGAKLLPKGTILLTSRATIGECSIAAYECSTNQGFQSLIANQGVNNEFLFYLVASKRRELLKRACGSTFLEISANEVRKIKVKSPSIDEQNKIASLLALIDERIATQSRIIDKLQSLMSGIAESLTTNTPNTKISDCLVCHSSSLQENQIDLSGKYRVYGASGICGFTDQPEVTVDSILIVKDGSGVGTVSYADGEYSVIGTSNYLTAKDGYLLRYLYYCLMCFNFTPYKTGMAIPHIYFKDYGKAKIYCPPIEEQARIATAISKIESKIETEQSILQQYTIQKRHLFQQMFI